MKSTNEFWKENGIWVMAIIIAIVSFYAGMQTKANVAVATATSAAEAKYADKYYDAAYDVLIQLQGVWEAERAAKQVMVKELELELGMARVEVVQQVRDQFQEVLDQLYQGQREVVFKIDFEDVPDGTGGEPGNIGIAP